MAAGDDLATGERLLAEVSAGVADDALAHDPGTLAEIGRLRTRLDAAAALAARNGASDETAILARALLLDLFGTFPTRVNWTPERSDEALHLHHAAIGRALLAAEARL